MKNEFKHKIGIIICWYGNWPWYFKYFLHSVKFNPSIDFIILTDEPIIEELPKNVKLISKSLENISELVTQKIGFEVSISSGYKLCDFRPAYGEIFDNYILDYDFWGHCDIDMIFGNIRNFIDPSILNTNDIISVRKDYITGCFALYKNKNSINSLYKSSKDFKKVFSTSDNYAFDECNGLNFFLMKGMLLEDLSSEIESITSVVRKKQASKEINAHFDFCLLEPLVGKIRWENGMLTYNNKIETIAYHLYNFKKEPYLTIPPKNKTIGNYFYIGRSGIYIYPKKNYILALFQRAKGYFKKYNYLVKLNISWYKRCKKASSILQKKNPEYLSKIIGHYKNFNANITILEKNNSIYVKADDGIERLMYFEDDFTYLIKEQYLTVEFNKIYNNKDCFITTDGKKIKHMYYKQNI